MAASRHGQETLLELRRCVAHDPPRRPDPRIIWQEGANKFVQASYACDECGWLQVAGAVLGTTPRNMNVAGQIDSAENLVWHPSVGVSPPFEDVPPHIGDAATEAHRCYSIQAYRGATSLARAVIEASAKDKGITKGQLHAKIEALENSGHIRAHIRDAAHEVRHLGNEVAHGDFVDPIEAEEAEEALALMGEVLQEVFQSPARVARVKAAREAKKTKRAAE